MSKNMRIANGDWRMASDDFAALFGPFVVRIPTAALNSPFAIRYSPLAR